MVQNIINMRLNLFLKASIYLKVRLSKTCSNPNWFTQKQLRNNGSDGLWDFYKNCLFKASGFWAKVTINMLYFDMLVVLKINRKLRFPLTFLQSQKLFHVKMHLFLSHESLLPNLGKKRHSQKFMPSIL